MRITWYGHSAFRIDEGNDSILIDPFLSGNPSWDGGFEEPAKGVTHVLLTHGHDDHVGDALDILKQSGNIYLGNPLGLVLHFTHAPTVYHMGDTDIFGDMALIHELHHPNVAMVPIGDRFTMGGAVAALACRRYFDFQTIFPCHFATFGVLDPDASKFVEAMAEDGGKVVDYQAGRGARYLNSLTATG